MTHVLLAGSRRPRPWLLALALVLFVAGCIPSQVKQLNRRADKAVADRKYEQAISYYSQSLALYPDQEKVRLQLDSARVMLRQIYVDKIYELVDRGGAPVAEYLRAWRMSAALPELKVETARVATIRLDLSRRFASSEKRLRAATEDHNYYLHLAAMQQLVAATEVRQALHQVAADLEQQHLAARTQADQASRAGLALLHTAAAATFAPDSSGHWAEARARRQRLQQALALPLALQVQSAAGQAGHLLGGLRRRIPEIFSLTAEAPLTLALQAGRPEPTQREASDRLSARCQVGTRREPNLECDSLARRVEAARLRFEGERQALAAASNRCAAEEQASSCTSAVSNAQHDLARSQREYDELEQKLGACPRFVELPVYKVFFYERRTIYRQVALGGTITLRQNGQVLSSRSVQGSAAVQDSYGDGLACAEIPPDPLELSSAAELLIVAEDRLLQGCLEELLQIRRRKAEEQLAGGEQRDQRLDALVRARLVDDSFKLPQQELTRLLEATWSADFELPQSILR